MNPKVQQSLGNGAGNFRLAREADRLTMPPCLKFNCRCFLMAARLLTPSWLSSSVKAKSFTITATSCLSSPTRVKIWAVFACSRPNSSSTERRPKAKSSRLVGVPLTTVKRCMRRYREHGAEVFFKPPARRQGRRLTPERLKEAQSLLDQGKDGAADQRSDGHFGEHAPQGH